MPESLEYFETSGDSMWPLLRTGDKVLVRRTNPGGLRTGDLVVYRDAQQVICHRFVRVRDQSGKPLLYCRGDAVIGGILESVEEDKLVGKVVALVRGQKIFSLERGLFSFHGLNRWIAPVCLGLIRLKAGVFSFYEKDIPHRRPR